MNQTGFDSGWAALMAKGLNVNLNMMGGDDHKKNVDAAVAMMQSCFLVTEATETESAEYCFNSFMYVAYFCSSDDMATSWANIQELYCNSNPEALTDGKMTHGAFNTMLATVFDVFVRYSFVMGAHDGQTAEDYAT